MSQQPPEGTNYGVQQFDSTRLAVQGLDDGRPQPTFVDRRADTTYRTTLVVRRYGEATFPVKVVTTFADGQEVTETWDGQDRWRLYTYDRASRAEHVIVDPERILLLDVNYTNNSAASTPDGERAATKWSLKWMVWLQDLMLTWGFFV